MADNKYTKAIQEIKQGIVSIIADMKLADVEITKIATSASKIGGAFKVSSPDGLNNVLKEQTFLLKLLSTQIEKQTKNTERLSDAKRKLVVLTGQEKINNRQLAKNADLYAQSTSKLVGAYQNLIAKQKMAKRSLQDLTVQFGKNSAKTKQAQKEYDILSNKINKANKATSNFSKNSLGGMVRGFNNLIGAFGIVLGAQGIVGLLKNVFETIRTIEKLEFTLSTVAKTTSEFAATQLFLSDITQRFGIDLVTTTERFTKFLAAANQSNLSFQQTTTIFEGVSKAAAVLGLRTDELSGVYLALEQMLSKGKVTTEELRRQLGERLPGAVGIMADALGVTTSELDKMLKKGEVLSSDALPKFAKALEEAYNLGTVKTVDTLVSSQQRLSNSWIIFVDTVNTSEGKLTSTFKSLINFATETIVLWGKIIKSVDEFNVDQVNEATTESFRQAEIYAQQVLKSNGEFGTKMVESMVASQNKLIQQQRDNIASITDGNDGNKLILNEETKKQVQEMEIVLGKYIGTLDGYNKVLDSTVKVEKEVEDQTKKKMEAVRGSIAFMEQYIKKLESERQNLASSGVAYREYTEQINNAKDALFKLKADFENTELENKVFDVVTDDEILGLDKLIGNSKEVTDKMAKDYQEALDRMEAYTEFKADTFKDIFGTLFDTFSDEFDFDFSSLDFAFDSLAEKGNELFSKDKIGDWADFSKEAIGSVLDASLNSYDIELQAAQRSRDLIINNELASEREKRIARQLFDEEERRIQTERAKKERDNTLIKIAVDTASAIVKATAQTGILAPAFIPLMIGIGLAQAAIVASQPLPRFAQGTEAPLPFDMAAIVGDGGRQEAITENGKLVGVTPNTPTVMNLKKGQEVQKDAQSWINNAVYRMNMESNGEMLSSVVMDNVMHDELKRLRSETQRTWQEVKKLANRPISVSNRVVVESKYDIYKQ